MEINSLNQYHEDIMKNYISFVQKTVYIATDEFDARKFLDFNEILENIIIYSNAFNKIVKSSNKRAEWAYMTPNLILYACIGFLAGIKNGKNNNHIDELSEDLFEKAVDVMGETTDILEDINIQENIQKKILTNINKINEHNN